MRVPGRIVLAGGGHAHLQVVESFGKRPLPGWQVVLLSPGDKAVYSGMLPGFLAGHYRRDEIEIDLPALCRASGIEFIRAGANDIDRTHRHLLTDDGQRVAFDLLSLDIGGASAPHPIAGAEDHAVPVRSIDRLLTASSASAFDRSRRLTVIGGGAGGVEIALALHRRALLPGEVSGHVQLVTAGSLLEGRPDGMRRWFRKLFQARGILLVENAGVAEIGAREIALADGRALPSDATFLATGPAPHDWLARTDLDLENGFVAVRPTLQSLSDPNIFAAGDCATPDGNRQLKSGVNAVRAGAILAENLHLHAENRQLKAWHPPKRHLMLLATGGQHAVACWGAFWCEGRWIWRLKNRIDRNWVSRFTKFS